MSKPTSYQLLKDTYQSVTDLRTEMTTRIDKIDERVNVLEQFRSKVLGIAGIAGAVVSLAVQYTWKKFFNNS